MNDDLDPSSARAHAREPETSPENTGQKQAGGRFTPGQSGNPKGKPPGARHAALIALDLIGQEGAEAALRLVVGMAQTGDLRAAEILLRRIWPERKGRPVQFTLPPMGAAGDLPAVLAAVAAAIAAGDLTPDEGQAVASVLESHRRAIETATLEKRLDALERAMERGT